MNDRIKELRNLLFEGTHKKYRVEDLKVSILNEETLNAPFGIRKAMAFDKCCELAPIFIQPGELIVGGKTVYKLPEYITRREIENGPGYSEVHGYTDLFGFVHNLCQDERGYGVCNSSVPAYYKYLPIGLPGMLRKAEEGYRDAQDEAQKAFYESARIVLGALQKLIGRYEQLAEKLNGETTDVARKGELAKLITVLKRIQTEPPEDFYEALQLLYFIQFSIWMEGGYLVPLGRMDQYLYLYYRQGIESGRYTKETMCELLECMFIKLNYEIDRTHGEDIRFNSDTGQTVTIGGIDPVTGKDVTNELSYMLMDIKLDLRITDPRIHLRLHAGSPDAIWEKAAELTAAGMGFPTYDNDEAIFKALSGHQEYSMEDIRDYVGSGCWEIVVQGKSQNRNLGDIDCLRSLEWALNDGKNVLPINENAVGLVQGRWGIRTGPAASMETFTDLMNAFKAQMKHNIDRIACNCNAGRLSPSPLYAVFLEDCLERGKDISDGGCRYYETDFQLSSLSNCADALYTIKKLVYEEGRYSLEELNEILRNNFDGHEDLRQEMINKLPKFGNDNDEVDAIAAEIVAYFSREVTKHKNSYNGPYRARISSALGYVSIARGLGASADGRKQSDFYATNLSAGLGAEHNGPTGVIKSCGKLCTEGLAGGEILDMRLHPNALQTEENRKKFIALVKAYFKLGGLQVQFNVIDNKTLIDAKAHPEKYPDLLVRVWGFSAYFIAIPEDYQDQIIARAALGI